MLGFWFITSCNNNTENNCIISHSQNKTALQFKVFLNGIHRLVVTNKRQSGFRSADHCQGQPQTPRSVTIRVSALHSTPYRLKQFEKIMKIFYHLILDHVDSPDKRRGKRKITECWLNSRFSYSVCLGRNKQNVMPEDGRKSPKQLIGKNPNNKCIYLQVVVFCWLNY